MAELFSRAVCAFVGRQLVAMDAIEHEGEFLAVVQWSANPSLGLRRPEYVLPIASVKHQHFDDPTAPYRWALTAPLPAWIEQSATRSRAERRAARIRKAPALEFPIGAATH